MCVPKRDTARATCTKRHVKIFNYSYLSINNRPIQLKKVWLFSLWHV